VLDAPPYQVMIETTVYEIYVDNESKIGLDYIQWKNGPGRQLFTMGAFYESARLNSFDPGDYSGDAPALFQSGFRGKGHNYSWFLDVPSAFFDYLVAKGKARVMCAAKLAARNHSIALLTSRETLLYYRSFPDNSPTVLRGHGPDSPDSRTEEANTVDREDDAEYGWDDEWTNLSGFDYGLALEIHPIVAENEINLDILVEVINHVGFDTVGRPVLNARGVDTEVRCRDGQEVILGGLTRELFVQRSDKIPFLGSLPVVGWLFGGEGDQTERRQVVIVLTPHIIDDFSAMNYEPTRINAALIKSKAEGDTDAVIPRAEVGFDQWLLDDEEDQNTR